MIIKKIKSNHLLLLLIPLVLSAFTHIWNIVQFPSFHPDEGVYIRRALHTLAGYGIHDPSSSFDHSQDSTSSFDHPYFGHIFLAGIFGLIGYPDLVDPSSDLQSIEKLYLIPRLVMGILAVVDTFLIYKISEKRFNRTVAIFSAILFAVMPLTWFTRRIVLDSIMLPFILTSVLLALQINNNPISRTKILCLLSGVLMGIAVFTKIPAVCFIPLLVFLIYQNLPRDLYTRSKSFLQINKIKVIMLWFVIPSIIIPSIWPIYAISTERFDEFMDGLLWQGVERYQQEKSLFNALEGFWKTDPILLILGTIGMIYCLSRKELFPIIWLIPYLIFLYQIGWVSHFHFIPILPPLCIAIAKLIYDISHINKLKNNSSIISFSIISSLAIFGLVTTTLLISTDLSYVQLYAVSFIANEVESREQNFMSMVNDSKNVSKNKQMPVEGAFFVGDELVSHEQDLMSSTRDIQKETQGHITVITSPVSSWIYKYVFGNYNNTFSHIRDTKPIQTSDIILLADTTYNNVVSKNLGENLTQIKRLNNIYNNTMIVALFKEDKSNYDKEIYPFIGMDNAGLGARTQEIRTNY